MNLCYARSVNVSVHTEEAVQHSFLPSDAGGYLYSQAVTQGALHSGKKAAYQDWALYTQANGFSGSCYAAENTHPSKALEIKYTITGSNVTSATGECYLY